MISVKRLVMVFFLMVLLFSFCGKDESSPFSVTGTVYLDGHPKVDAEVEFGIKSAGNWAATPWKEQVKKTDSSGAFSFTTVEFGYAVRLRVRHPVTGEWSREYIDYEDGKGKSSNGGKWTYDFNLTTTSE